MATARSRELHRLAGQLAAALPPVAEEIVLTGSVSRGVADEVSDIEMLVVTRRVELVLSEPDPLEAAFALAELQADTLALAPSGPNVDRARRWVDDVLEVLRRNGQPPA